MKNGQEYGKAVDFPRGHPRNPTTTQGMKAKFENLAQSVLSPAQTAALHSAIRDIENVKDITRLSPLFCSGS